MIEQLLRDPNKDPTATLDINALKKDHAYKYLWVWKWIYMMCKPIPQNDKTTATLNATWPRWSMIRLHQWGSMLKMFELFVRANHFLLLTIISYSTRVVSNRNLSLMLWPLTTLPPQQNWSLFTPEKPLQSYAKRVSVIIGLIIFYLMLLHSQGKCMPMALRNLTSNHMPLRSYATTIIHRESKL